VVPARRFSLPCPAPLAAYKTLKDNNPSPYMFFMRDDEFTLFGASPESALNTVPVPTSLRSTRTMAPARAVTGPTAL